MITRSSRHILKYNNNCKTEKLNQLFEDYLHDLQLYVDDICNNTINLNKFMSSKDLFVLDSKILHSQWKQILYKNASEIVRSNLKYQSNKRYNKYKKCYSYFKNNNRFIKFTNKKFSELKLNTLKSNIKISIKDISINIDSRLFDIEIGNSFDNFVNIKLPYFHENKKRSIQINLPIKQHKHSLKYKNWNRKNTIKLLKLNTNFYIDFIYDNSNIETIVENKSDKIVGIDIGYKKLITTSESKIYGNNLQNIYVKLSKKKRGSKKYKKLLVHKNNLINQGCNNFISDHINYKRVICEDLKNVKFKSKVNTKFMNKLQYWTYSQVLTSLKNKLEEHSIEMVKVSPAYTSQTCSNCGTIDKENRKGELYNCSCGYVNDADVNAAINIVHRGVYNPSNKLKT